MYFHFALSNALIHFYEQIPIFNMVIKFLLFQISNKII
ncbi:hypothetical protein I656_02130 [Geobacillus sp. WSUCF1]|nr:hypothetical protein I656_02130 [Geobacillus sp. WSUCF1]